MRYYVESNYTKKRNGRFPNETVRRKVFKKILHAIREAEGQRAKNKHVEAGCIFSAAMVTQFMTR